MVDELVTEIETIVESELEDLNYYIEDILDDYQEEELEEFFRDSEEGSFNEARAEFEEDEYSDEELRLFRIKFIGSSQLSFTANQDIIPTLNFKAFSSTSKYGLCKRSSCPAKPTPKR